MSERIDGAAASAGEGVLGKRQLAPSRESAARRAHDTEGVLCQTHIGGQALLEGIMMRGRYNWAVAVREANGSIYTEQHDLISGRDKNSWMYKPVVRGCTALVESMALSYRALTIASEHAFAGIDESDSEAGEEVVAAVPDDSATPADGAAPTDNAASADNVAASGNAAPAGSAAPADNAAPAGSVAAAGSVALDSGSQATAVPPSADSVPSSPPASGTPADAVADPDKSGSEIPKPLMTASMIIGLLLGIGIFIALPALITNLIVGDYGDKTLLWNIVDGVLRIVIFIVYIWLIGRMPDIQRMFGYHGAEHKTIHCYEHGLELTPANAQTFPTLHVRCGTAFMLMTMIIAILVFTIVPVAPLIDLMGVTNPVLRLLLVILVRIILLPLVAGFSYEVTVKWAGSRPENPIVRVVLWPGMQMQRLTTRQPDEGQLQCAIAAMQLVLEREDAESKPAQTSGGDPAHNLA
ncbi:MAG: DUF1385 domain-containing protein [Actinomycetia bacterium]|nr:DUF1385 domain-containing protein [Actinomycetes bacterium]